MNNTSLHYPHGLPEVKATASMVEFPSHANCQNSSLYGDRLLNDRGYVSDGGSADVQSSEGVFLDAKSSLSNMETPFVPIRVRISDENDDEECDASLGSSGNFDSVSERMASLSNTNSVSPSGSFKEFFAYSEVSNVTFDGALRKLNELNSGVSSLDTSLLENTSEESFRFRMMEIALSNRLSLDDEVVHDILNALLPVVRENIKQSNPVREAAEFHHIADVPVARPTADNDDDNCDGLDDVNPEGFKEASDLEQSEDGEFLPYSAQGLPVRGAADDESEEHVVCHFSPSCKLPVFSQMTNRDMEVSLRSASGEMENQNSIEYGYAKRELSMSYKEPDLMQHYTKNARSHDSLSGENDLVKEIKDASFCCLIEADANEDTSSHNLHNFVNKSKLISESGPVAMIKDASISRCGDRHYGIHRYHLEETKQEASRNLLQQTVDSFSLVGCTTLSVQHKAVIHDNLLCRTTGGFVAGHSEVAFVSEKGAMEKGPKEHPFDSKKILEGTDNGIAKFNDDDDEMEPTDERVLSLKLSPATSMPFIGNAKPSLHAQPAALEHSISLVCACSAVPWSNGAPASFSQMTSEIGLVEGIDHAQKKLQLIGAKFLRLAHRLDQSAHNVVVAQVLYRLELIEQLRWERTSTYFSLENLMSIAEKQEAAGQGDLDFECTILVLGKSGVGKSATLNSLFDEMKSRTDAYKPATKKVNEITGTVKGIKLRIINTPGLLTSFAEQQYNLRIMSSVKRYLKKSPPDIVLYFDRLDMQCRDYGDLFLLHIITDMLGSAIWYNAIVVLTHGSSPPPDGANGLPISYELFVAQRSHVVQQTIRQAAGDMRLVNPVSVVENHVACEVNKAGDSVLPNGQVWKPQLLLLCFASKILAEANTLMKLQDSSLGKSFWVPSRVPPLPFLLSSMLQSRAELKLSNPQVDDEEIFDSDEEADSDSAEDYDDLPPFRRLARAELRLLDKEQRRLYYEELEYREKLFVTKQWKAERARKKELKRRLAAVPEEASNVLEEHLEEETPAAVPVTMPDMVLPLSFDSGDPTHRYRCLDTATQSFVRPVLDAHGWDNDNGYDGLHLKKVFALAKKVPVLVSGEIKKDKKDATMQLQCATSFKNGDGKITQAGLDIQTLGKDFLYSIHSETKFSNLKKNKTTCGLSVTVLGDTVAAGMKLEDHLLVGKRFKLVMNGGALMGHKDVAYGGSLEASIRDKDYPIGNSLSTLGISIMNWHGDLAIGGNLQLQFLLGKTMIVGRANFNKKKTGQVSIRASRSDQLQMAFVGLIPLLHGFINSKILGSSQLM